jgi:hypothetical protein
MVRGSNRPYGVSNIQQWHAESRWVEQGEVRCKRLDAKRDCLAVLGVGWYKRGKVGTGDGVLLETSTHGTYRLQSSNPVPTRVDDDDQSSPTPNSTMPPSTSMSRMVGSSLAIPRTPRYLNLVFTPATAPIGLASSSTRHHLLLDWDSPVRQRLPISSMRQIFGHMELWRRLNMCLERKSSGSRMCLGRNGDAKDSDDG